MNENKQNIIIVLLVANLILMIFIDLSINRKFESKTATLFNQIDNVSRSIASLDNSITQRIQNMLDERDNKIVKADYEYKNIDAENQKADLDVSIMLKAVSPNSKIFLSYSERSTDNIQEVELTKKSGLSFVAGMKLDLDKNYQYDVIERNDGGGETLLNLHQQYISLYDEFYNRRFLMDSSGSSMNNERIEFDLSFSVDDFGMTEFGLEKVVLELSYEDEIIDRIDVTNKITMGGNGELKEQYHIAIAAGKLDPSVTLEEYIKKYGQMEDTDNTRQYYNLVNRIDFDTQYPELDLDLQKAENLHMNVTITFKDGYKISTADLIMEKKA